MQLRRTQDYSTPPPKGTRQNKWIVIGGLVVITLCGVGYLIFRTRPPSLALLRQPRTPPPQEHAVLTPPSPGASDLRLTSTYEGYRPPQPEPEPAAAPPPRQAGPPPATPPKEPKPPKDLPPPAAAPTKGPVSRGGVTPASTPVKPPEPPRRWYTPRPEGGGAQMSELMGSPHAEAYKAEQGEAGKESKLFPAATWEKPADPLRVIYSTQLIQGSLEQAVVTGETATVRIRVTETLYDRWGQQRELVPMDSQIQALAEGTVKRGQDRVRMAVQKLDLPDGSEIELAGLIGDQAGAAGVPGDVDNRYKEILFASGIAALLSIGSRAVAGNTSGFQPTLEQQFAAEISQSVNNSGQQIVRNMFDIQPKISVKNAWPVTVQLQRNVNLQGRPRIIK
jgi:type IV secretion system protein TrbI